MHSFPFLHNKFTCSPSIFPLCNQRQEYGLKVFDLLGEQGVASEAAMAIYAEFHQQIQEFEKLMAKRKEEIDAIIAEEKTLFKH